MIIHRLLHDLKQVLLIGHMYTKQVYQDFENDIFESFEEL